MNINLSDVLSSVGNSSVTEASVTDLKTGYLGENLTVSSKAPFTLNITCVSKGVVEITGEAVIVTVRPCGRCLADVNCEYPISINCRVNVFKKELYIDDTSEADEISYIEDCTLDVDGLILDELFTKLPMNVLCKEDCRGICKVCGTNLNTSSCDCDQTVPDPRMAVFSDIFKDFNKEV